LLGLVLLFHGRQPVWLEDWGRRVWRRVRQFTQKWGKGAPLMLGVSWALLPCGLLYSALLVAAMAGGVADGSAVMALFALGTSVSLLAGPWLILKLNAMGRNAASGAWGVRLAGLALAGSSAWGLYMGLVHNTAPWCATA
jgi:sulfite exporter TauE/SafE